MPFANFSVTHLLRFAHSHCPHIWSAAHSTAIEHVRWSVLHIEAQPEIVGKTSVDLRWWNNTSDYNNNNVDFRAKCNGENLWVSMELGSVSISGLHTVHTQQPFQYSVTMPRRELCSHDRALTHKNEKFIYSWLCLLVRFLYILFFFFVFVSRDVYKFQSVVWCALTECTRTRHKMHI